MNEITDQQKYIESSQERLALTWPHNPATQLITYPEMIPDTSMNGAREINSSATRFKIPETPVSKKQIKPKVEEEEGVFKILSNEEFTLGARRRAEASKKVDLENLLGDGTDTKKGSESPRVNGFGFVMDPSSTPSKHDPIITWGEIEGTPLPLDAMETPSHHYDGPGFKVPQTPKT
jgi:hypothetical protein